MTKIYKTKDGEVACARTREDAEKALGTTELTAYDKPSQKAFMMWIWLRCDRKDGRMLKYMLGEPNPAIREYKDDPNIVRRELRKAGIRLSEWLMIGEEGYDQIKHAEFFYRKENIA